MREFAPSAVEIAVEARAQELALYVHLEAKITGLEREDLATRWEFGRQVLAEAKANGGRMPHGRLSEIAHAVGKSRSEIKQRVRFAKTYPKLDNALSSFRTWYEFVCGGTGLGPLRPSSTHEWYTPAEYVGAARTVLGGIEVDPASCPQANETVRATRIFTREDDGLAQEWHGRVFLNPPYGKWSGPFAAKLIGEYDAGRVSAAVLLLNAYGFDAEWFQPLWRFPICFTDHRIDFHSPDRESGGPTFGNVFVYLGPEERAFIETFDAFGNVVRRCVL